MAREIKFFPSDENFTKEGPHPVIKIWAYGAVEIERRVGARRDANNWKYTVTRTIRYPNASKASWGRLHRAVAKRLNKGQASIDFIHGSLGLGYEVEL